MSSATFSNRVLAFFNISFVAFGPSVACSWPFSASFPQLNKYSVSAKRTVPSPFTTATFAVHEPCSRLYSRECISNCIRRSFQSGDSTIFNIVKNIHTKIKNHINRTPFLSCGGFSGFSFSNDRAGETFRPPFHFSYLILPPIFQTFLKSFVPASSKLTRKDSKVLEKLSKRVEILIRRQFVGYSPMTNAIEAQSLLRELYPEHQYGNGKASIYAAYVEMRRKYEILQTKWTLRRVRSLWNLEAQRVDSFELDALRAEKAAHDETATILKLNSTAAYLAEVDDAFYGPTIDQLRNVAREIGLQHRS